MKNTTTVSVREAWAHFVQNVKPEIWDGLTTKERTRISNANRDFHGKRRKKNGEPEILQDRRIKAILSALAPGRYRFIEQVEIC